MSHMRKKKILTIALVLVVGVDFRGLSEPFMLNQLSN